jgi:two-component system sensor histidine kinase TctE
MTLSLRTQLIRWLLLPILCVGAALGFAIYRSSVDLATETFDVELAEQASSIATRFQIKEGLLNVDMTQAALDILTYDLSDQFFFTVTGPHGRHIAGNSEDFPVVPANFKMTTRPTFYDGVMHNTAVRIAVLALPIEKGAQQLAVIQVAETLAARQEFERRILLSVVTSEIAFFVLLLGVLWIGIAQSLKPLGILTEAVDRRPASDLTALPAQNVPKEIAPLIVAINRLLARVSSDVDMRNRFIANAAHQLRTPLAGLQTQSELALRTQDNSERNKIIEKIVIGCDRAARVVHQLLVLAKFDPNAGGVAKTYVDLQPLVSSCIEDRLDNAIAKAVEVSFDCPDTPIGIVGDALLIRELVSNLLDNAIRYTGSGGKVNVRIHTDAGTHALLEVSDSGPGIPEPDRERIFERFYRVEGAAPGGSGLGLAIVSEIAAVHNGQIELRSEVGKGTTVAARFALASPV